MKERLSPMPKKVNAEKHSIRHVRSRAGKAGKIATWGERTRPNIERISVEEGLRAIVEGIPLRDRVRVTSQALRAGLKQVGIIQ